MDKEEREKMARLIAKTIADNTNFYGIYDMAGVAVTFSEDDYEDAAEAVIEAIMNAE